MTDVQTMHGLHRLANYPVLAALARPRTEATRLDGRACHFLYSEAISRIDWATVSPDERSFIQRLGIDVPQGDTD